MNVSVTPQAFADLVGIHNHIVEFSESTADRVLSRIRQVMEILRTFPLIGRPGIVEGTREFAVTGLPYTIIYRIVSPTDLDILTVLHQRRLYPPER